MSVDPGTKKGLISFDVSSSTVVWVCDNKTVLIYCALKKKKKKKKKGNSQSCTLSNIGVVWALKDVEESLSRVVPAFQTAVKRATKTRNFVLPVLSPTNQTCLATGQVFASCVNTDF